MPNEPDALSQASTAALELYHDLRKARVPCTLSATRHSVECASAKNHILLTVNANAPSESPRVMKSEQVSANRWLWDVKVFVIGGIDHELMGWLRAAYELCN